MSDVRKTVEGTRTTNILVTNTSLSKGTCVKKVYHGLPNSTSHFPVVRDHLFVGGFATNDCESGDFIPFPESLVPREYKFTYCGKVFNTTGLFEIKLNFHDEPSVEIFISVLLGRTQGNLHLYHSVEEGLLYVIIS